MSHTRRELMAAVTGAGGAGCGGTGQVQKPVAAHERNEMEDLNLEDVNLLIEAIGSWESSPTTTGMMGDLIGMSLAPSKEKAEEFLEERKEREADKAEERQRRKERAILLQAKLIYLKDHIIAAQAI